MRCNTPLLLLLLAAIGCTPVEEPVDDTDTDPVLADTDTDADLPTNTIPTDTRITAFAGGLYRIGALDLMGDDDVDSDGVVDNNLVNALALVDGMLPTTDLSLANFNATINTGMAETNIILLEFAVTDGEAAQIGVLYAEENNGNYRVDPASLDAYGDALIQLEGAFVSQDAFGAGPGEINFPAELVPQAELSIVTIVEAHVEGTIDDTISNGQLSGVLPVRSIIDDMIAPLIPPEGFDVDGDGINETVQEVLDLVESIAPLVGDVTLPGGEPGVSCTFSYFALPITL